MVFCSVFVSRSRFFLLQPSNAGSLDASDLVLRLYAKLKIEERELLNMRYVMELKDREIASLLGLSEKAVNKRYQRLLAKCRELLE